MPIETERKFLIRPQDIARFVPPSADWVEIEQAYIVACPEGTLRVRRRRSSGQDVFLLTCKGSKTGGSAEEIEFPISWNRYSTLAACLTGRLIRKIRFMLKLNGYDVEIDVFQDSVAPLCMAEVEGPDCAAFVPPAWFGREVTGDSRYDNGALALAEILPPLV